MKLRKSSIIGIAAATSVFVCLGVFLFRGNILGSQAKPDYNEIINEFNKEYGTSYQIATDEQLSLIGVAPDERDAFIGSMSADEFKEYLTEIHNNAIADPLPESLFPVSDNTISENDVETVRKNYGEDRPVYDTKIIDLDFDGEDELLVLTARANPRVFEVWEKNGGAMDLACSFGEGKVDWIDKISLKQDEIDGEKVYLFSFAYDEENSMKADEVLSVIRKTADGYEVEHLLSRGTISYQDIAEPVTKEFYRRGWSKYDIGMDKDHGDISKEEYEKLYKEYTGEV